MTMILTHLIAAVIQIAAMYAGMEMPVRRLCDVADDPLVRREFWTLLAEGRYGFARTEEAAFLVREGDGDIELVRWPRSGVPHQSRWRGQWPSGVVGIVHTHPNDAPEPSAIDVKLAQRRGVPVYVVTRGRITKTKGGRTHEVARGDWEPRARNRMKIAQRIRIPGVGIEVRFVSCESKA